MNTDTDTQAATLDAIAATLGTITDRHEPPADFHGTPAAERRSVTTPEGMALFLYAVRRSDRLEIRPDSLTSKHEPHRSRLPDAESVGFTWSKATPARVAARVAKSLPDWQAAVDELRDTIAAEEASETKRRQAWRKAVDAGARPNNHNETLSVYDRTLGGFDLRPNHDGAEFYLDRLTIPAHTLPALLDLLGYKDGHTHADTHALSLSGKVYAITRDKFGNWEARDPQSPSREGPRAKGKGTLADAVATVEALTH